MIVYTLEQCCEVARGRLSEDADFSKKSSFQMKLTLILGGGVCKQAKLSHLRHRKTARIHWKVDALKTSHFLVWILVQMHNWAIFLRKWARKGRYSQCRSCSWMFTKIEEEDNGNIWFQQEGDTCHSRSYTRCFAPCFWRSHYQPQSWCRLLTSGLRFDTVELLFVRCCQR